MAARVQYIDIIPVTAMGNILTPIESTAEAHAEAASDRNLIPHQRLLRWLRAEGYTGQLSSQYVLDINARIARIIKGDMKYPSNRKRLRETL